MQIDAILVKQPADISLKTKIKASSRRQSHVPRVSVEEIIVLISIDPKQVEWRRVTFGMALTGLLSP